MSMDAAIMMLNKPDNMSDDDWWLHVYVMLSRVRTARQGLVFGLPNRELFERGPPQYIVDGLARLEQFHAGRESALASLCKDLGLSYPAISDHTCKYAGVEANAVCSSQANTCDQNLASGPSTLMTVCASSDSASPWTPASSEDPVTRPVSQAKR